MSRASRWKATRLASAGEVGAPWGRCGVASRRESRNSPGDGLLDGHDVRAQPGQRVRDGLRIARGAEDAVDARRGDGREEVLEVQREDHPAAGVPGGVRAGRAALDEPVRGVVRRNPDQQLAQDPALDLLQPQLRALQHARRAVRSRDAQVGVVAQLALRPALEPFDVREPGELPGIELESLREVADGVDPRHRPAARGHLGVEDRLAQHPRRPAHAVQPRGDERGELPRPVTRRAVIRVQDLAGDALEPHPLPQREPRLLGHRVLLPLAGQEGGGEDSRGFAVGQRQRRPDGSCRACAPLPGDGRSRAHAMHCSWYCDLPGETPETHRGVRSGRHRRGAEPYFCAA